MSRPIRYQPEEWSVFFVTGRCIHSRFLLRPLQRVNSLIVGVLARAVERFDVKLFGICFLSNHYHLLLSSKDAGALASFMQYVGSNIAREVGRQHRWRVRLRCRVLLRCLLRCQTHLLAEHCR
jgi:REP element-mobilizing transposase RayT